MEDWDQATLEKVVESKKAEYNQNKPTEIVLIFFLSCTFASPLSYGFLIYVLKIFR